MVFFPSGAFLGFLEGYGDARLYASFYGPHSMGTEQA